MIIAIRQWKVEDWLDNYGCPANTIYSTTVTVDKVPFYAEFSHFRNDITIEAIKNNWRLVTVIPNNTTDTDVANKLIFDAFQNNPALRYLIERSGKK